MKNLLIGFALAALAAGTAFAVESGRRDPDADGNGILTRAEAEARAASMFARRDVNKDGKLDQADREARRALRFDRLDANKDGQLSRAEFTAKPGMADGQPRKGEGLGHHEGGRHGMMGGRFAGPHADADKDGAVTQAEFTHAWLGRFDRIDADKNGRVTREERHAARRHMREIRHAPDASVN